MNRVKFIVAEQSYLIRKGIVSVINRIESASVIHEADNLDNINSLISKYNPHYIVLNPNLIPDNRKFLNFKINTDLKKNGIAISSSPPYRKRMLDKFNFVLFVNDSREVLFEKLESLVNISRTKLNSSIITNELSAREKTILTHVAKGETNREIAEKLHLSSHTVITHRKNITAKLGIKTISGLTVYAILNKFINPEDINS